MEAGVRNVLFKQNDRLQFLIAIGADATVELKAHLSINALDFDPSVGDVEIALWEQDIAVPVGRTSNILARVPLDEVRKCVHCRDIQYEVQLKPSGSVTARRVSFRSPRMASTFADLTPRSVLKEELKRKKTIAYREYMKETK